MQSSVTMPATASDPPLLQIQGVHMAFRSGRREIVALRDINLQIERGEFICILGPSGCGKSTLLNAIAGFAPPTSGTLLAAGVEVTEPGPDRAMVFQEYALFPWMTVAQNVAFGLEIQGADKREVAEKVAAFLDRLQLTEFRDRFPKDLSGGMRQRVAIARALALDAPVLLMDEPFGALDALTRQSLQDELLRIWSEFNKTIVFVTHSIQESIYLADRIAVLTYRPGTVKKVVAVTSPRPRDMAAAGAVALTEELTRLVMEEQMRFQQAERETAQGERRVPAPFSQHGEVADTQGVP